MTRSCRRSTTAGWRRPKVVSNTVPRCRTAPRARQMDFGFYYRPTSTGPHRFHVAPVTGDVAVLLRHDREREPDRELHRHRQGRAAAKEYFGAWRTFPTPATGAGRRRSRRRRPDYRRRRRSRFEGAYPYDGLRSSRAGAAACSRR
jgi:hypothetical protein